jgi:hypothetical protein
MLSANESCIIGTTHWPRESIKIAIRDGQELVFSSTYLQHIERSGTGDIKKRISATFTTGCQADGRIS